MATADVQKEIDVFLEKAWRWFKDEREWLNSVPTILPPRSNAANDDVRLVFSRKPDCHFLIGIRPHATAIRVGLVTTNRWISEGIEQAVLDNGGSMTEFLEDEMEADEDLEHELIHYHDSGEFYFISEIPSSDLSDPALFEKVCYYFAGYLKALENHLEED